PGGGEEPGPLLVGNPAHEADHAVEAELPRHLHQALALGPAADDAHPESRPPALYVENCPEEQGKSLVRHQASEIDDRRGRRALGQRAAVWLLDAVGHDVDGSREAQPAPDLGSGRWGHGDDGPPRVYEA